MQAKNIQLAIFDWDGTLFDSNSIVMRAHHMSIQHFQLSKETDEQIEENQLGKDSLTVSKYMVRNTTVAAVDYQQFFRQAYQRELKTLIAKQANLIFPNSIGTVRALYEQGIQCAVATNKPRETAEPEIQSSGLLPYLSDCQYADETRSKPDPIMLQNIMKKCGCAPENTIMIGDQTNDVGAAQNAGTACIILYEKRPPKWQKDYPETVIFCHHQDSAHVIKKTVIAKSTIIDE